MEKFRYNFEKIKTVFKEGELWWKLPAVIVISIVLIFGAILGYRLIIALKNILVKNLSGSAPALFGKITPQKLRGEGDGRINILLLGVPGSGHTGPDLADTIIVISLEPEGKGAVLLSLPRDLWVKIPSYGYSKINSAHAIGEKIKYEGGGPQLTKETIESLLDLPIHYFVRIDFSGFKKIIDTLGGVEVVVEKDIVDYYYPRENGRGGRELFSIKKGTYNMDGELALKYARSRQTTSDFDRARRQQQILVAAKNKALKIENLLNISRMEQILKTLGNHLKTDFQFWEIRKLAEIGKEIDSSMVSSYILDNSSSGILYASFKNGAYVLLPKDNDYSKIAAFAHQIFDDIYIKEETARIEILNGTFKNKIASSLAEFLKSYGYNIVNVKFAEKRNYQKTIIYDYSAGKKPYTVSYLQKRLEAQVIKAKEKKEDIDIQIILGQNYKGYFRY